MGRQESMKREAWLASRDSGPVETMVDRAQGWKWTWREIGRSKRYKEERI